MIDLTEIIVALVGLVSAVVGTILIPYLQKRLTAEQQKNLAYWIEVAASAAEGIFNYSQAGEEKYNYVVQFLKDKGFKFDEKEIKALIESVVYNTINQFKDAEGSNA